MNALSIFAGCGGLDIAAEMAGITILLQCEIDDNCQTILSKHWPDVKKWKDVKTLDADAIIDEFGPIDLIFGGPPCQPVSVAGRREAAGDERNMWPHFLALIRAIRPRWVVAENPTGVLSAPYKKGEPKGTFFGSILREMDAMGYVCGWGVWGACDVEHDEEGTPLPPQSAGCAPHQRERVFIVAYADSERELQPRGPVGNIGGWACDCGDVADDQSLGRHTGSLPIGNETQNAQSGSSGDVADTHHAGLQVAGHEPGHETFYAKNGTKFGSHVGNTSRAGREERDTATLSSEQGHVAGKCACGYVGNAKRSRCDREPRRRTGSEPADGYAWYEGRPQPRLGGNAIRPPFRLDFPGWPAGRGAEQYEWEPPRVIPGGGKGRAARLKMLGNMVMPYQAKLLFEEIVRADAAAPPA